MVGLYFLSPYPAPVESTGARRDRARGRSAQGTNTQLNKLSHAGETLEDGGAYANRPPLLIDHWRSLALLGASAQCRDLESLSESDGLDHLPLVRRQTSARARRPGGFHDATMWRRYDHWHC